MASVVVPTRAWTDGCEDVLAGLAPEDELIVVADHEEDPVVESAPARAKTVVAGDPVGCSGKANALVAGMERASDPIVVWSDADVDREPGWRDRLVENAREEGAATEVPIYVAGGLWSVMEPSMAILGSLGLIHGGYVWGGGVAFDRRELDEEQLLADLRRTVGDDSLLSTRIEDPWVDREHPRHVPVEGDLRGIYHRLARWVKGAFYFEPVSTAGLIPLTALVAAASLLAPLLGVVATTAVGGPLVSLVSGTPDRVAGRAAGTRLRVGRPSLPLARSIRRHRRGVSRRGIAVEFPKRLVDGHKPRSF